MCERCVNCVSVISYVPSMVTASSFISSTVESTTLINGNLPIIEDGFIVGEATPQSGMILEWFVSGVVWISKNVFGFLVTQGDSLFVLVAICGIFCMMAGYKKLGTKMTSGSILGYIVCKVVSSVCQ